MIEIKNLIINDKNYNYYSNELINYIEYSDIDIFKCLSFNIKHKEAFVFKIDEKDIFSNNLYCYVYCFKSRFFTISACFLNDNADVFKKNKSTIRLKIKKDKKNKKSSIEDNLEKIIDVCKCFKASYLLIDLNIESNSFSDEILAKIITIIESSGLHLYILKRNPKTIEFEKNKEKEIEEKKNLSFLKYYSPDIDDSLNIDYLNSNEMNSKEVIRVTIDI